MNRSERLAIISAVINAALLVAFVYTYNTLNMERADIDKGIKVAAKIGFTSGCMVAVGQLMREDGASPTMQLYGEWCAKNGSVFSSQVEFK